MPLSSCWRWGASVAGPDFGLQDRRRRERPPLLVALCAVLCAVRHYDRQNSSAIFLRKFMIAAACCEVMCLVVSSLLEDQPAPDDGAGMVALLVVMNIAAGDMMVPLMIAILAPGRWPARLYLGHNGQQVLADSAAVRRCGAGRAVS